MAAQAELYRGATRFRAREHFFRARVRTPPAPARRTPRRRRSRAAASSPLRARRVGRGGRRWRQRAHAHVLTAGYRIRRACACAEPYFGPAGPPACLLHMDGSTDCAPATAPASARARSGAGSASTARGRTVSQICNIGQSQPPGRDARLRGKGQAAPAAPLPPPGGRESASPQPRPQPPGAPPRGGPAVHGAAAGLGAGATLPLRVAAADVFDSKELTN